MDIRMNSSDFDIAPTRIQEIEFPALKEAGISLFLKREDEIHPAISGNKWRKLKYNLLEARAREKAALLTFGGAFSNHIYAVAAAGYQFGFRTKGIIRGEAIEPLNPTLAFAKKMGMKLHFVSRGAYREKAVLIEKYQDEDTFVIPEGGTNEYALKGCAEIVEEVREDFDYYCCSVGTGGTVAGIIQGLKGRSKVLAFSALKGGFLQNEIQSLLEAYSEETYSNWALNCDYHFGGYAKFKPPLLDFMRTFKQINKVALDPIYTGKMLYGIVDLARKGYFTRARGAQQEIKILAIHTGGLQGIQGFEARHKIKL